eukprot:5683932-Amphidinium_carterae.1
MTARLANACNYAGGSVRHRCLVSLFLGPRPRPCLCLCGRDMRPGLAPHTMHVSHLVLLSVRCSTGFVTA